MSLLTRSGLGLLICATAFLSQSQPVQANWFPWLQGGYGYGAPAYGGYYAGYSPMWSAAPMGYYSAGYAPMAYGCAPSCCSPCATGCGTGGCGVAGCGTGGCGAGDCAATSSDSLKPAVDPAFRSKSDTRDPAAEERDPARETDPANRYERDRDPVDGFSTPNRAGDPAAPAGDRWDPSGTRRAPATDPLGTGSGTAAPAGGSSGTGLEGVPNDGLFGEDALDRKSNRPPMSDPLPPVGSGDVPAGVQEPKTESPFLDPDPKPGVGIEVPRADDQVAVGSQLREVIPAARLAGRSLTRPATQYSASGQGRPIRWISVPTNESHVRL